MWCDFSCMEHIFCQIGDVFLNETKNGRNGSFFRGWLPHRGKVQMACNLLLPHDDNIPNKLGIWKEGNYYYYNSLMRKPYQLPGWTKNSSYYVVKSV